jgi:hypothetical protein
MHRAPVGMHFRCGRASHKDSDRRCLRLHATVRTDLPAYARRNPCGSHLAAVLGQAKSAHTTPLFLKHALATVHVLPAMAVDALSLSATDNGIYYLDRLLARLIHQLIALLSHHRLRQQRSLRSFDLLHRSQPSSVTTRKTMQSSAASIEYSAEVLTPDPDHIVRQCRSQVPRCPKSTRQIQPVTLTLNK